jgi:hypothetical protein
MLSAIFFLLFKMAKNIINQETPMENLSFDDDYSKLVF